MDLDVSFTGMTLYPAIPMSNTTPLPDAQIRAPRIDTGHARAREPGLVCVTSSVRSDDDQDADVEFERDSPKLTDIDDSDDDRDSTSADSADPADFAPVEAPQSRRCRATSCVGATVTNINEVHPGR